jgi:hypothetical protein
MLKRWRDVERTTTSAIERIWDTGRPVDWRSASWITSLMACGSPCVRTTHPMGARPRLSAFAASGTCACGMYIAG